MGEKQHLMPRHMTQLCPVVLMVLAAGVASAAPSGHMGSAGLPAIAAGGEQSLKLNPNGLIWVWGNNFAQGLGPVRANDLSGVIGIAAGPDYDLALTDDGTVWAWGWNIFGQLGDGTGTNRTDPTRVIGLGRIVSIAAGFSHSLAVRNDGTVWAWGRNDNYQVSRESPADPVLTPVQVSGLSGVVAVAGGSDCSLALKNDGTVWIWGRDNAVPVQVSGLSNVVAVAAGYSHRLALKSDGTVWAWGSNYWGELGDGTTVQRDTPVRVSGLNGMVALAAGGRHSLAVKNDGTVWAWGWNEYGQLGDGTTALHATPVQVSGLTGAVTVAAGTNHSLAVRNDGVVWGWGRNDGGQLGDGTTARQSAPVQVNSVGNVIELSAGETHSVVAEDTGLVRAWGANDSGQLGDGTTTNRNRPTLVSGLDGVNGVAAQRDHSLAARNDGSVWAWGGNAHGQLGVGGTTPLKLPARINGLNGVTKVAAGVYHSLALRSDGSVWAWGWNVWGQLGNGTTQDCGAPVLVSGLSGAMGIAGGNGFSIAVKLDGTVWAWGQNSEGQLGDGTKTTRLTPVQVGEVSGIVAVAVGGSHSLALKNDGTVWAWGGNSTGQLGAGDTGEHRTAVQVVGLSGIVAVAAGAFHNLAVGHDGTVWGWGTNSEGELGAEGNWYTSTPVRVMGLSRVIKVAAGALYSLALKGDGTVWAWGRDSSGQLGVGKFGYSMTPVQTLPTYLPGAPIISLSSQKLVFGGKIGANPIVPPAQEVALTQRGSTSAAWTVLTNKPWLQVSPASGTGNARLTVSVRADALPLASDNTASITVMSPEAANAPVVLPVTLQVAITSTGPFGSFDTPAGNATPLSGSVAVTGWALDDIGVKQVTIWRDPVGPEPVHPNGHVYIGDSLFVAGVRPDVESKYPLSPNVARAGWGYLLLTNTLPGNGNGTFQLHAYAVDQEGNQFKLGTKRIVVDNVHSVKPFGAIDTPAPGETINGSITNSGWALTPQPASIALDGSTVWVNIDGIDVAHPLFGSLRPDVASVFPGRANTNTSGGQFVLDSSKFANGMHTISWNVYDNQGHADGVGSRYFYILNSGVVPSNAPVGQPAAEFAWRNVTRARLRSARLDVPSYRRGYEADTVPTAMRSGGDGLYEPIVLEELERIELNLPTAPVGANWTGALRAGDEMRPLPVGSTLDEENGVFYWQLGPGFLGEFQFEFSQPGKPVVPITIRVVPKGSAEGANRLGQ